LASEEDQPEAAAAAAAAADSLTSPGKKKPRDLIQFIFGRRRRGRGRGKREWPAIAHSPSFPPLLALSLSVCQAVEREKRRKEGKKCVDVPPPKSLGKASLKTRDDTNPERERENGRARLILLLDRTWRFVSPFCDPFLSKICISAKQCAYTL
jgi:hypothetical protein